MHDTTVEFSTPGIMSMTQMLLQIAAVSYPNKNRVTCKNITVGQNTCGLYKQLSEKKDLNILAGCCGVLFNI